MKQKTEEIYHRFVNYEWDDVGIGLQTGILEAIETALKEGQKLPIHRREMLKEDWCFCEFTLQKIIETEENRITGVSDGMFKLGGSDLSDRCYPLEMKVKQISDTVAYWSREFHRLKNNSLNHPELNIELIRRWVELCDNREDENRLNELYDKLYEFGNSVLRKVRDLNKDTI